MDYKELSDMCRYLSDTPSYTAFHDKVEREIICDSCNGGLCYDKVKDAHWCMYEALQRASVAITELIERAENAEKIVDEYAESARAIALWLSAYCDKTLSYPSMISNAARKISVAYADMEKRAEQAEKERDDYKELFFAYKHVCGGVSPDRIGELVESDKAGKIVVLPVKPNLKQGVGESQCFILFDNGEIVEDNVYNVSIGPDNSGKMNTIYSTFDFGDFDSSEVGNRIFWDEYSAENAKKSMTSME